MDQTPKQRIVEKLKVSSSVLITVSNNPNVDQLCGALGLVLMLNALDIHSTAIVSGAIPNALEFLHPEKTFDSTVDVLRDFIISIDKDKASKLRYKPEENVVKIFITPYKSQITEADLTFSQGDINVDTVIALGVTDRKDLDTAIMAHGRILHDATVASISAGQTGEGDMGSINWNDPEASSICEMLVAMSEALASGLLDEPMSTALLTGIVSATERFSNAKTTPKVMTMAAQLMASGANQQLIAKNLKMNAGRVAPIVSNQAQPMESSVIVDLRQPPEAETPRKGKTLVQIEHDLENGPAVALPPEPPEPLAGMIKDVKLDASHIDRDASKNEVMNAAMPVVSPTGLYSDSFGPTTLQHAESPDVAAPPVTDEPVAPDIPAEEKKEVEGQISYDPEEAIIQARDSVQAALASAPYDPSRHPLESVSSTSMEMTGVGNDEEVSEKISIDDKGHIHSENETWAPSLTAPAPDFNQMPPFLPQDPSIAPPFLPPMQGSSETVAPPVAPPLPPKPDSLPPSYPSDDSPPNPLFGNNDQNPPLL